MELPVEREPRIITRRQVKVYENQFATVYDDEVSFADGGTGTYLRVVEGAGHPGVAILATCADHIALVLVYRYPTATWEWGVPRGFGHGPDAEASALAELDEELGAAPATVRLLARMRINSGLLAGETALFHAEYAQRVHAAKDVREVCEVRWISLSELSRLLTDPAVVVDGFTLSTLAAAALHGIIRLPAAEVDGRYPRHEERPVSDPASG